MKCAVHAEVDATGYCRNCGKALCPQCTREVRGVLYCEECLAARMAGPVAQPAPGGPNPGVAAVLGIIPGLGAVYNNEYTKALIHVLIFGGLIALLNEDLPGGMDAFFGVTLGAFCLYMPIEAYRTAKARAQGRQAPSLTSAEPLPGSGRWPLGPIVLIVLGVVFLLGNLGILSWFWVGRFFWPVLLIVIGLGLLWRRMQRNS